MASVVTHLQGRFPEQQPDTIIEEVRAVHRTYEGAPVRDFVPLLVQREAAAVLKRRREA